MEILEYIVNLNWQTMIAMAAIAWYFTHDIKEDLKELKSDMKIQNKRIDTLYQMFVDLLKERSK